MYQSGITLALGEFPYGGPEIGTPRFPLKMSMTRGVVGAIMGGTAGLTPASCQHFDVGANASAWTVFNTNTAGTTGFPPLMITGTHATDNYLSVAGNSFVGWGMIDFGVTSVVNKVVNSGSGKVTLGSGTTPSYVTNCGAGEVVVRGTVVSAGIIAESGTITLSGSGAIGDISLYAGALVAVNNRPGGNTITSATFYTGGTLDLTGDGRQLTIITAETVSGTAVIKVSADDQLTITTTTRHRGSTLTMA